MVLPQYQHVNSLNPDGSRKKIYPADVRGKFHSLKDYVYPILMAVFFLLPWLRIHGHRLFLLDVVHRRFFIFGLSFNAQDIYLVFFLLTGVGFLLFFITALYGRIFCGWLCPQTVFLEGVFRKIERWIEGPRSNFFKEYDREWTLAKVAKLFAKNFLYVLISFAIAITFLLFFVPQESYREMLASHFTVHPTLLLWTFLLTGMVLFNYGWFREQTCLIVCPYGRFQSLLTDDDSLVIGYDQNRGEPRGKPGVNSGDCIDCGRCVIVCPTGIDIRNGLQLECIGCANCVDACNEIMSKIGKPRGLIRYDSLNGFEKKIKRFFRPRVYGYFILFLMGIFAFSYTLTNRTSFEANILRFKDVPYSMANGSIRNQFEIHLFNKSSKDETYLIEPIGLQNVTFTLPLKEISVPATKDFHVPIFVEVPESKYTGEFLINIKVTPRDSNETKIVQAEFLGFQTDK